MALPLGVESGSQSKSCHHEEWQHRESDPSPPRLAAQRPPWLVAGVTRRLGALHARVRCTLHNPVLRHTAVACNLLTLLRSPRPGQTEKKGTMPPCIPQAVTSARFYSIYERWGRYRRACFLPARG